MRNLGVDKVALPLLLSVTGLQPNEALDLCNDLVKKDLLLHDHDHDDYLLTENGASFVSHLKNFR